MKICSNYRIYKYLHKNFVIGLKVILIIALSHPCYGINKEQAIKNMSHMAELEFLESDLSKAEQTFIAITDLALDNHWTSDVRKSIFQAYFRLAQLKKTEASSWIKKAIEFAPDLKPDYDITPKNLVQNYDNLVLNIEYVTIKKVTNDSDLKFQRLINGSDAITRVVKDKIYRIDYLTKDPSSTTTHYVLGAKINSLDHKKLALDSRVNANKSKTQKPNNSLATTLPAKIIPEVNFNPDLSIASSVFEQKSDLGFEANAFDELTNQKSKKTKSRNTWVIVASAVLALTIGGVLMSNNNDSPSGYEPNSKKGF